jgi:hypothetical protein
MLIPAEYKLMVAILLAVWILIWLVTTKQRVPTRALFLKRPHTQVILLTQMKP